MLMTTSNNASRDYVTIADVRQRIATNAYEYAAKAVFNGELPREQVAKALSPIQDMLHKGVREAGHADMIKDTVNQNLDGFLAELEGEETDAA
jgi:hypothetical protein